MYQYRVKEVIKVQDGDTLQVRVSLGFGGYQDVWLRFAHINTPALSKPGGAEAKAFVEKWLAGNPVFYIDTTKTSRFNPNDKQEKYERYLAVLKSAPDAPISLNQLLLDAGLAKPYEGTGPKE